MNHEKYIKIHLSKNLIKNKCKALSLQKKIIEKCISRYNKHEYENIDLLINDSKNEIDKYSAIGERCTAEEYSEKLGVCMTTARRHLRFKINNILVNKQIRPYIYTLK